MSEEQRIAALFEIYSKATDRENAEKGEYKSMLDDTMFGGMNTDIQSYDYLDNEKYLKIQKLLKIMNETFGFDEFVGDGYKASMSASKPEDQTPGEANRAPTADSGNRQQDIELPNMGSDVNLVSQSAGGVGNSTYGGTKVSKANLI